MKKFHLQNHPQPIKIKPQTIVIVLAITFSLLFGCSHTEKVRVPPRVELKPYSYIGVVEFSTNAEDNLGPYVTQNFIQHVQSAQPGTRILELGSEEQILRAVERKKLDLETIKLIGNKFNVDAVIVGHLEVSEIIPKVNVFTMPESLNASADVEALLSTRLLETGRGATLWTQATSGMDPGHIRQNIGGKSKPDEKWSHQLWNKRSQGKIRETRPQSGICKHHGLSIPV
jgi:hypothetical protein